MVDPTFRTAPSPLTDDLPWLQHDRLQALLTWATEFPEHDWPTLAPAETQH